MKSKVLVLLLATISYGQAIKLEPAAKQIQEDLDNEDKQSELTEMQKEENQSLWAVAEGANTVAEKSSKSYKSTAKANQADKEFQEKVTPSQAGVDVQDWAQDDAYFSRVMKNYAQTLSKADGSEMPEKCLTKEDGENVLRQILTEKLDSKKDEAKKTTDMLVKKFYNDNWDYYDAATEGFIEVSRAHQMIHKTINQIRLDDELEDLKWKTK